jgi:hypothetical protein
VRGNKRYNAPILMSVKVNIEILQLWETASNIVEETVVFQISVKT